MFNNPFCLKGLHNIFQMEEILNCQRNSQGIQSIDFSNLSETGQSAQQLLFLTVLLTRQVFEKMAESMTEMAKAIMQQNMMAQRHAVASQLPKLEIPVFNGDPLRYRLWKNAFSNLVDSQPLIGATKPSYFNSYVAREPKKVVDVTSYWAKTKHISKPQNCCRKDMTVAVSSVQLFLRSRAPGHISLTRILEDSVNSQTF